MRGREEPITFLVFLFQVKPFRHSGQLNQLPGLRLKVGNGTRWFLVSESLTQSREESRLFQGGRNYWMSFPQQKTLPCVFSILHIS